MIKENETKMPMNLKKGKSLEEWPFSEKISFHVKKSNMTKDIGQRRAPSFRICSYIDLSVAKKCSSRPILLSFFLLIISQGVSLAKDYGVHGHTFEITEPDLLKQITNKLVSLEESGGMETHNKVIQKRVENSIRNPQAVKGLTRARETRSFAYDPSITVPYDLKDHDGQTFHKAGTIVNPLTYKNMGHKLVFIAGNDPAQVDWALETFDLENVRLVLTSGSPFDLMDRLGRPVFFDQQGSLTTKFSIKNLPATVEQDGRFLMVTEVAL